VRQFAQRPYYKGFGFFGSWPPSNKLSGSGAAKTEPDPQQLQRNGNALTSLSAARYWRTSAGLNSAWCPQTLQVFRMSVLSFMRSLSRSVRLKPIVPLMFLMRSRQATAIRRERKDGQ
jgi:hypothetical protein